jgi:hypothetical protein
MPIRIDLINRINMEVIKMDRITEFDGVTLDYLIRVATLAQENGQSLKLSQRDDGMAVKRGEGAWTASLGRDITVRPQQ